MSIRILILKDGVITFGRSPTDNTAIANSLPISNIVQSALSSKADLVDGKIPAGQLPAGSLTLGVTSTTAYRGDYGTIAYDHAQIISGNPHGLTAAILNLGNVNNTSDVNKPISTATQTALDLKANLVSPAFTGTPTVPTAVAGTNTTQAASTGFVSTAIGNLINSAPGALDTLNELSAALGNDPNFATTITNSLALKAPLASPTFTGTVSGITAAMVGLHLVTNTSDASKPVSTAQQTALDLKANLASPTFTGTVAGITSTMVGLGNVINSLQLVASNSLSDLVNRQTALNNISGGILAGNYLRGNGTNIVLSTIQAADVPTLNQNTTGTASNVTGIVAIANGGTGSATLSFVNLTGNQTVGGVKTFSNNVIGTAFRAGAANIGSISLTQGGAANAGYLELFKGDGTTRLGYIGFDNVNLNYVAESGASHSFHGGRLDIIGGVAPPTTGSRVSHFVNGNNIYSAWISGGAPVNYKGYDICNILGDFYIRRFTDSYTAVAGNILSHNTSNILTLGNAGTRSAAPYGSMTVDGQVNSYAGIQFTQAADSAIFMFGTGSRHHGVWSPNAAGGWHWIYNVGNLSVHSSAVQTEGSYIGLYKGLGSLPGYGGNRYPTISTDFSSLYFSIAGVYSAHMTSNGVLTAVSDKDKKNVIEKIDSRTTLEKIARLPIARYSFKNEDQRVTHIGTFAQEFWKEFQCGGNQEIIDDLSPNMPDKMLSITDVVGVCLSGIQGLIVEINNLKLQK